MSTPREAYWQQSAKAYGWPDAPICESYLGGNDWGLACEREYYRCSCNGPWCSDYEPEEAKALGGVE